MGFANLKKTSPSVNRKSFTVDEFIEDAIHYSEGRPRVVGLHLNTHARRNEQVEEMRDGTDASIEAPFKRSTFTLSQAAIEQLSALSEATGVARSRLMRIWLDEQDKSQDIHAYLTSQIR